jgi:hypothetical protein
MQRLVSSSSWLALSSSLVQHLIVFILTTQLSRLHLTFTGDFLNDSQIPFHWCWQSRQSESLQATRVFRDARSRFCGFFYADLLRVHNQAHTELYKEGHHSQGMMNSQNFKNVSPSFFSSAYMHFYQQLCNRELLLSNNPTKNATKPISPGWHHTAYIRSSQYDTWIKASSRVHGSRTSKTRAYLDWMRWRSSKELDPEVRKVRLPLLYFFAPLTFFFCSHSSKQRTQSSHGPFLYNQRSHRHSLVSDFL